MHSTIWRQFIATLCVCLLIVTGTITGCVPPPGSVVDGGDDDETVFVEVADATSEVAGVVVGAGGDSLGIIAAKDAAGDPIMVTGVNYQAADGSSWSVFLDDDGLPDHVVVGDWVFAFSNYTTDTVDVTVLAPDGTSIFNPAIDVNPDDLAALRSFALSGLTGSSAKASSLAFAKSYAPVAKINWSKLVDVGGAILSAAGCAVGVAAILSGAAAPVGIVLTAAGCVGSVGSLPGSFLDKEDGANVATGIGVVTCASAIASVDVGGVLTSCGSLAGGVASRNTDDAVTASDTINGASICGNGICEAGESSSNCPVDCGGSVCGNGVCESGETSSNCTADCERDGGASEARAYYPFDEGSGTLAQDTTGDFDGLLQGSVSWGSSSQAKEGNSCVIFGATGDAVSLPGDTINDMSTGTLMCWVYPSERSSSGPPSSGNSFIVSKIIPGSRSVFTVFLDSNGRVRTNIGGADGFPGTTQVAALNAWTHIAITWDGSVKSVYMNGVFDSSGGTASVANNPRPTFIGMDESTPEARFIGRIDEVWLFDRALSAQEVSHCVESSTDCGDNGTG